MQAEIDAAVAEWKVNCGRESEADAIKLGAFAESIRFQFGPRPAVMGKPFFFHAGNGIVFTDPFVAKKDGLKGKARKVSRVKALKTERSCSSEIVAPWSKSDGALHRVGCVV